MEYWHSAWLFLCGVCKRAAWFIPPLVLDPFDIAGKVFGMSWIVPQWSALSLFVLGWIIAIILTYHELRMQNVGLERDIKGKATISTVLAKPKKYLRADHSMALSEVAERMERIHGHSDIDGLRADVKDGVLVSDLLSRNCTRCGKPRNQEGDSVL